MSNKKLLGSLETQISKSDTKPLETHAVNNLATVMAALEANNSKHKLTITPEMVELLGAAGVTVRNACSLLHKSFQYFDEHPIMKAAYERGRATLGSKVRTKLIEAALDNNNIQSAIHLDKIFSADAPATEVNVNIGPSRLSTVSDEDLLAVAFTVDDDSVDGSDGEDTFVDSDKHSITQVPYDSQGFDDGEGFDGSDDGSIGR